MFDVIITVFVTTGTAAEVRRVLLLGPELRASPGAGLVFEFVHQHGLIIEKWIKFVQCHTILYTGSSIILGLSTVSTIPES